jgi:hypothetical protein
VISSPHPESEIIVEFVANGPLPEGEGIGWLKIRVINKSPHSFSLWEKDVKEQLFIQV